jgi:hypothetical protein
MEFPIKQALWKRHSSLIGNANAEKAPSQVEFALARD